MKKLFVIALAAVALVASSVVASAQYKPSSLSRYRADLQDQNGQVLSDQEVFQLIGEDIYNETYKGARTQYKAGNALIIAGAATAGVGLVGTVAGVLAIDYGIKNGAIVVVESKKGQYDLTKCTQNGKLAILGYAGGVTLLAVGATCLAVGIPLKVIGTKRLNWVAEDYNNNAVAANLNVGFTANGAGLVLNF